MTQETMKIQAKILEIADTNSIYMTMKTVMVSNQVNYNKAQFLDEFIYGVIENSEKYIGIPFQVNRVKLENGIYSSLTHELDTDGNLKTDTIGSFVGFEKEEIDGANCLVGTTRIFKRYPKTCNAILDLYEDGLLETSVEVLVGKYENTEDGIRQIGYENNELIGHCLVTNGAEKLAKPSLLIAQALTEDLKGGENVDQKEFNKGFEIKYQMETASIKLSDIANSIYNLLNPINAKSNYREYNYYIKTIYNDYVIVEDWDDYETCFRIPYRIENDTVVLAEKDKWIQGTYGFIPNGVDIDALIAEKEQQLLELSNKIDSLKESHKEELETMSKQTEVTVEELQAQLTELSSKNEELSAKVAELSDLVVSQKEEISSITEAKQELASKVEELTPFKEQVEKAEKDAKVAELSSKYSKLLSEETMKSERVQIAIAELNTVELAEIVVEETLKEKELASKQVEVVEDNVVVTASRNEDLLPTSNRDKWYSTKSE